MRQILSVIILLSLVGCSTINRPILLQKEGFIFSDLEDESKLVGYFLTSQQKDDFKKLDVEDKWQYISEYWKSQGYHFGSQPNYELINITGYINKLHPGIVERIEYANKHFSNFKDGWETDMGRIYILHGEPFEVLELSTDSNGTFKAKYYHIWNYFISQYKSYLFIDLQQHGDFRLVCSDGDDQEGSKKYWENLLDATFDEESLHYWR